MKKKLKKLFKWIAISITTIGILGVIFMSLVFYTNIKPFVELRELWVTTAMKTFHHQWLATKFISKEEINRIMDNNKVIETSEVTNVSNIKIDEKSDEEENYNKNAIAERERLEKEQEEKDKIEVIDVSGDKYKGKVIIVHNPQRIELGVIDNIGGKDRGLTLGELVKKYNALGGINAGGFGDYEGHGNGGIPTGIVVKDGQVIYKSDEKTFNVVGFNYDNQLITGKFTLDDIKKNNIKDAVSFGPALIINGKPTEMKGDGGWGIQPRTAIGQTATGEIVLLTIDGRQPLYSVGASLKDMQDVLLQYNVVNGSNLDGGSSTVMYYDGKVINKPCGPMGNTGGRYLPTAFLITK